MKKHRLAIGVVVVTVLQIWIIRAGIMGGSQSFTPEASGPAPIFTNIAPPPPPPPTPNTGPLPSIDQPFRFWEAALRDGRLNTPAHQAAEGYMFKLALNHRITVKGPDGSVAGKIIMPGDVSGVDWDATNTTQHARLTENGAAVTLTPSMLQDLKQRRDRLLALGVPP